MARASKRGVFVIIGTNDLGDLKKFHQPGMWDGGMLAVWYSGSIYMSVPHRRVGKLVGAVCADNFWIWLNKHHIHVDKVYTPTANEFSSRLEQLRRMREDALVEGIAAQMLAAVNKPIQPEQPMPKPWKCAYCGSEGTPDTSYDGWPRCPHCHGC